MISVKTVISFSASRRGQLIFETFPQRSWTSTSRFYCHAARRQETIHSTAHSTLLTSYRGMCSPFPSPTAARSNTRSTTKRNFSSLKNGKEIESEAENLSTASIGGGAQGNANQSFLQRFLAPKEIPPRGTFGWYREMVLICTVFAITGSSTMMLVRPAVSNVLGLKGSFREGPWSYRICSIVIMTPIYASLLVVVGTLFGRHAYFRHFSVKIFSRFGIPPELMDKSYHETKHSFRKW